MSELSEEQKQGMRRLREGWDEVEAFETELLRQKSIQEKVQDFIDLLSEFWEWDEKTEAWYQAEREATLIEIQERLDRLERYRMAHGITD